MSESKSTVPLTQEEVRAWWPFLRVDGAVLERLHREAPKPQKQYEEALL